MKLPPVEILDMPPRADPDDWDQSRRLTVAMSDAGVKVDDIEAHRGASVVRYDVALGRGGNPKAVERVLDALSLSMGAVVRWGGLRGTRVSLEVPRAHRATVKLRPLFADNVAHVLLGFPVGTDAGGKALNARLANLPHMLVAGGTGSGKSTFMNAVIVSLLMRNTPDDLQLVMIDPKRVELAPYAALPHLAYPIVTDVTQAVDTLDLVVLEMERRFERFEALGVKDISGYNSTSAVKLPRIVVVIDELADLMMTSGPQVESAIVRISQLARAAGIHLVIATQRPEAKVVTGKIKTNIPGRAVFRVASHHDSKIALDYVGAERLLGNGDGLWLNQDGPVRFQSPLVSEDEIARVVAYWVQEFEPVRASRQAEIDERAETLEQGRRLEEAERAEQLEVQSASTARARQVLETGAVAGVAPPDSRELVRRAVAFEAVVEAQALVERVSRLEENQVLLLQIIAKQAEALGISIPQEVASWLL